MAADMKYAQITSVDVERSFSKYKLVLTERRTNMSSEHMEQYIVINCLNTLYYSVNQLYAIIFYFYYLKLVIIIF